jgi:hypothetical protein
VAKNRRRSLATFKMGIGRPKLASKFENLQKAWHFQEGQPGDLNKSACVELGRTFTNRCGKT